MSDHYQILGVSQTAGKEDIKRAYRKQAKLHHPDVNPGKSEERFKQIAEAYQILSNSGLRYSYDLKLNRKARNIHRPKADAKPTDTQSFYRQYNYYAKKEKIGDLPPYLLKPFFYCIFFLGVVMVFVPIFAVQRSVADYWGTLIMIPFGCSIIWISVKQLNFF